MLRVLILLLLLPMMADASDVAVLQAQVDALKYEIGVLDNDISECESGLKRWEMATVIGSVGTVATGVGAAVQGSKLHKLNKPQDETIKSKDKK